MSTATIYAHRSDAPNDERTGRLGGDEPEAPETWRFSIDVAERWEREVAEAPPSPVRPVRRVLLRTAIVFAPGRNGPLAKLLGLVRRGLGGRAGDGRQRVSWIHGEDYARAVRFLIERADLDGPVNLAAPHPLPNATFMRALREACGARVGLPAPAWLLELGAFLLRTETELVLKSRYVVPTRLLEAGFRFAHPEWPAAARDLVERWRAER